MSVISKIFGSGKKGEAVPSPSESVQRLRDVEEMLQKKSDFLEQKIEHEVSVAKKNSSKNKQGLRMNLLFSADCVYCYIETFQVCFCNRML